MEYGRRDSKKFWSTPKKKFVGNFKEIKKFHRGNYKQCLELRNFSFLCSCKLFFKYALTRTTPCTVHFTSRTVYPVGSPVAYRPLLRIPFFCVAPDLCLLGLMPGRRSRIHEIQSGSRRLVHPAASP